jgi:hypothetical protein
MLVGGEQQDLKPAARQTSIDALSNWLRPLTIAGSNPSDRLAAAARLDESGLVREHDGLGAVV